MESSSMDKLEVFGSAEELSKAAAEFIISVAGKSIAEKGRFSIAFSGGQTPVKLYSLLAEPAYKHRLDWEKIFIFWGDERCVPLDDQRNNAHQAKSVLLDKINIPARNIHIMPVNSAPEKAAANYEKQIQDFFGSAPPRFDMVLLGLGENGHTASLFPHTKVIAELRDGVEAVYVEEEKMYRVTLTAPLINRAHHLLFLVTGKNKADILKKVLSAPLEPEVYPAQLIRPTDGGELTWFVDHEAAANLIA